MSELNFELVKDFILSNKDTEEVQALLREVRPITRNVLDDLFEQKDPEVTKYTHSRNSKSINTFKDGTMEEEFSSRLENAKSKWMEEANPKKDPALIRIEELERKLAEKEKKELFVTLENEAMKHLPDEFKGYAKHLVAEDKERTLLQVDDFLSTLTSFTDAKVKSKIPTTKLNNNNISVSDNENPWKEGQLDITEQMKIYRKDPERAKKLATQAGKTIGLV